MSPTDGFTYEQYADIVGQPAKYMPQLIAQLPSAPDLIDQLLRCPIIHQELKKLGVVQEHWELVVAKALLVMYNGLGEDIFAVLIRFQPIESVAAFLIFAHFDRFNPPSDGFRGQDIPVVFLSGAVLRLTSQCGPYEPGRVMRLILNQINLPFYKHEAIHKYVVDHLPLYQNTLH